MKKLKILFLVLFTLITTLSYGQILKGTGLVYTNGVPTHTPRTSSESEYAVDVSTGKGDLYLWNRTSNTWKLIPEGIEVADNALVPSSAPAYGQSRFRVNNVPVLYFWTGITWIPLTGNAYTAGTGIDITGNVITNTGDLSNTNEIQYIDTLRLTGTTLEASLYNDGLPLKTVSLGSLAVNLYTANGTITDNTRVVSIPGNLIFSNNSASVGERFTVGYDNGVSSTNSFNLQEGTGITLSSSENNIFLEGQTSFRDVLSPSALTGNVNNYTGLNGGNVGILSSNGAYNITGIDNGVHGRILFLFNNGSFDLTLTDQDVLSDVENRFYMGSDYVLKADTGSLIILYDTLIPAWRVFKFQGEGGVSSNIYTDNGTTSDNTRTLTITETLNFTGINDLGDPIPFQVNVTGNEPQAQLWDFGTDSLVVGQSDTEIYFKTNTNFLLNSDASLIFQSDSVLFSNTSVENVPTVESILGFRNIGGNPTLKQVVGTQTGHVLVWDEPNQIWELDVVSVGGGDDWGAQYVQTDSSLQGRGLTSNPLTITGYDNASNGQVPSKQTDTLVWITPLLVEVDGSITNEIQQIDTFEIVSNILRNSLSLDGVPFKSVDLTPYLDNTDAQNLTVEGGSAPFTIAISGGSDIDINSGTGINLTESPANTMVITNSLPDVTVSLTNGGGVGVSGTYPNFTLTATDQSVTNEIQRLDTFEIVSNTLRASLLNDGVPFSSVNLAPYLDNTDDQVLSIDSAIVGAVERFEVSIEDGNSIFFDIPQVTDTDNQTLDTFEIVSNILRASLTDDGVPFKFVDLTPYTINIFNADGTQDDATRLFTQDSTRTFAMGQFTSVSTPTWGRGYYYDPSTANGIRLLNKDGGNTTTAKLELDPQNIILGSTHLTSDGRLETFTVSEDTRVTLLGDRTSDTYGQLSFNLLSNSNEEIVALTQAGKSTAPSVSMYLGDGYSSSTYAKYADRAWGVQSILSGGGFDWIQVLLPDTGTDSTGNNLNFYNRKYFWSISVPSPTSGDTSVHVWIGNGTTTTPQFVSLSDLLVSSVNIYNSDGSVNNREIEMNGFMNWVDNDGDAEFNVSVGSLAGGNLFLTNIESKINYFDAAGINTLAADGSGIELSTSDGVDDILISSSSDLSIIADLTTIASPMVYTNIITPTALSANTDNWSPTGLATAYEIRVSATTPINLTGIVAQENGREIVLKNVGNHPFTLKNNVTSTAANRFLIGYDYNVPAEGIVKIVYDDNDDRWFVSSPLSLGTGSGRLASGRAQDIYWSYQTDTLKDFALGYFTNGTTDDRTNYGKFGLHIDGSGGFSIQGKETYIKGSLFNQLGTSYMSSTPYGYEMSGISRVSTGTSSVTRVSTKGFTLYGSGVTNSYIENYITSPGDLYEELSFGVKKQLDGTISDKKDYGYLFHGGGETLADTSAISIWWGLPQHSDTISNMSSGGIRAISKERGWGVQSIFDYNAGGVQGAFKYDWIKIKTGSVPGDTLVDGITFYGNKYEIPNATPPSAAGDTSVIVWTSPTNSFFIDIDDIKGGGSGGNGIYGGDGDIPTGGSQVSMNNIGETVRFVMNTGNTTTREMLRLETVDNAFTRFLVFKGPTDSLRMFRASSGRQYTIQSYGGSAFQMASDSIVSFLADSLLYVEGSVQTKTKMRFILGLTPSNYIKRVEAVDPDQILISDGTDWVSGTLTANESNTPATIRPAQLTAKMDDWTPTGYSTTKTQLIALTGDGSFRFITGMAAATRDGVVKTLENEGATNCVGIAAKHTGSSAANRFNMEKDLILYPYVSATFRYDSVGAYWKLIGTTESSTTFNALYDVNTARVGQILSDNMHLDGQVNGGAITRSSAGNITESKLVTTNFSTGAAATGIACNIGYQGQARITGANLVYIRTSTRVRLEDLSTAAEDYDFTFGYGEFSGADTLARTKEGFFLTYTHSESSGSFVLFTHNGTTGTALAVGSPIAADTWYELELIYYPYGEVVAYIDGTRYSTTTTVTSVAALSPIFMIEKDAGTTARLVYTTYFQDKVCHVSE